MCQDNSMPTTVQCNTGTYCILFWSKGLRNTIFGCVHKSCGCKDETLQLLAKMPLRASMRFLEAGREATLVPANAWGLLNV